MKNNKYAFLTSNVENFNSGLYKTLIVIMTAIMISCSEDEPGQAPLDIGVLSASKSEVIIDYDKPTDEAVVFSWHAEKTPSIQYQLVFSSGSHTGTVEVSSEVTKKFTHAELNRILIDALQLEVGTAANVNVEVHAKVMATDKSGASEAITISVTPSTKVIEPPLEDINLAASRAALVINTANPAGETVTLSWAEEKNVFIQYKVVLTSGNKSATVDVVTDVSKEFTNAELNTILVDQLQLEVGKVADVNMQVNGRVIISDKIATSNTISISVTPAPKVPAAPAHTQLWIVGNATPNGWNIGSPNVMANDPANIYQFKFNEILNGGEFKIPVTTGNWGCDYYMPPVNLQTMASTAVKFTPGGNPDNKWLIENGGAYKMLLNISSSPFIKITPFTPYQNIYIIGDATDAGWDANNPIAMTVDEGNPNIFTWTGELKSTGRGQFRFLLETGDLKGISFVAPSSNANISATQLALITDGLSINNFKVKTGEDGTYKITVDQLKETISIVKQ